MIRLLAVYLSFCIAGALAIVTSRSWFVAGIVLIGAPLLFISLLEAHE